MSNSIDVKIWNKSTNCAWQIFEEKVILISPDNQEAIEMNEVGSEIWKNIDGINNSRQISDKIFSTFECDKLEIQRDVDKFINELARKKLIE